MVLVVLVLLFSCTNWHTSEFAKSIQEEVTKIRAFQAKAIYPDSPDEYKKMKMEFDVNDYFKILTSIKMKDGYRIDYIYRDNYWFGGPRLTVVNAENQNYFKTIEKVSLSLSYNKKRNNKILDSNEKKVNDFLSNYECDFHNFDFKNNLSILEYSKLYTPLLEYIDVNRTKRGYLEYVIFCFLSDQFSLIWHSNYDDYEIVATREKFKSILSENKIILTSKQKDTLNKINFEPTVIMKANTPKVKLLVFTKWGGLFEFRFLLEQINNSVKIKYVKKVNKLHYNCGILF